VIEWFKTKAPKTYQVTYMGGTPSRWRTLTNDCRKDPRWTEAFRRMDVIQPWTVGRYRDNDGVEQWKSNMLRPDLAWTATNGPLYMPVIFPGFSWHNLKREAPKNAIPRNRGEFLWRQAFNAKEAGAMMLKIAMFDEVNEGTAMFKLAARRSDAPDQGYWLTLDADGYELPSDWYLRIAGEITRMFHGEVSPTPNLPENLGPPRKAELEEPANVRLAAISKPDGEQDDASPSFEEMKWYWPCFLGTGGGLATWTNVPLQWDVRSGAGVLWKAVVPAPGHNSPIVWGDRVFLSGGDKTSRAVFCFHAGTGDLLWQRALDLPPPGSQEWNVPESAGMAYPTMVADGHRAYAIFANGDLAAVDFDGKEVWAKNLGLPDNTYGHTASLALWQNRLIVQMDQGVPEDHKARLFAFDSATGQLIWEKRRPVGSSWSSPIISEAAGKAQILTLAAPWAIAYDAKDGSELWRLRGIGGEATPTPILAAGLFFAISPMETLYAIKPDGQGDITKTHVAWFSDEWVPDICSPVSNGELLFTLTTSGTLTCYDAKTGKKKWDYDFEMEFRASPSIAGNRLYLLESTGKVIILEVNRQFKELARSDLGEPVYASPAFVKDRIYIRSTKTLFCIGGK
jgi:outer membrane protein assembly factor BamB